MAIHGNLAQLFYGLSDSGSWNEVVCLEFGMPSPKWASVDYTGLSDLAMRKFAGIPDNGEIKFKIVHSTANKALLATLGAVTKYYKTVFSDGKGFTFQAFVSGYSAEAKNNQLAAWELTLTIDGPLTVV